jgi:hypothetical protein
LFAKLESSGLPLSPTALGIEIVIALIDIAGIVVLHLSKSLTNVPPRQL